MLRSVNLLCWSDNVFGLELLVWVGLLEQEVFSAVCAHAECLVANLQRLDADKVFGFLLLELIVYVNSYPIGISVTI